MPLGTGIYSHPPGVSPWFSTRPLRHFPLWLLLGGSGLPCQEMESQPIDLNRFQQKCDEKDVFFQQQTWDTWYEPMFLTNCGDSASKNGYLTNEHDGLTSRNDGGWVFLWIDGGFWTFWVHHFKKPHLWLSALVATAAPWWAQGLSTGLSISGGIRFFNASGGIPFGNQRWLAGKFSPNIYIYITECLTPPWTPPHK